MISTNNCISQTTFELLKKGDKIAFEEIYRLYSKLIFQKVSRLCKDHEVCADLVQEAFTQLFINKHKIEDAEGVFPYLYTVSRRLAITTFRKTVSRTTYQSYLEEFYKDDYQYLHEKIANKDLNNKIHEIIDTLPVQQALVFKLNKIEDLSYKEIAEDLGVSHYTVRNQIAAATKAIRLKVSKLLTILF